MGFLPIQPILATLLLVSAGAAADESIPSPQLSATELSEISSRLGVPESRITLRPRPASRTAETYDFVSRGSRGPVSFGSSTELPPALRKQPVSAFKGLLSYSLSPETAARNERAFAALSARLEQDPRYEGVHLAETHYLGSTVAVRRLIVQRNTSGDRFAALLRGLLEPALRPAQLEDGCLLDLFALLLQESGPFAAAAFRDRLGAIAQSDPELKAALEPLRSLDDAELTRLSEVWQSSDLARLRELADKLRTLNSDPQLAAAQEPLIALNHSLIQRPIWSLREIPLNGDFGPGELLFWRAPDGHLNVTLYDF